ncbi:MAG: 3'-5' exonuclease [Clostridium fessum]
MMTSRSTNLRGANIENILSFEKAFPGARVIKLEQNYRSTQSILNAANEAIRHNRGRKDKTPWTANDEGPKVRFRQYDTAYEEADAIIRDIEREKEEKMRNIRILPAVPYQCTVASSGGKMYLLQHSVPAGRRRQLPPTAKKSG